jgi:hypothetical protein
VVEPQRESGVAKVVRPALLARAGRNAAARARFREAGRRVHPVVNQANNTDLARYDLTEDATGSRTLRAARGWLRLSCSGGGWQHRGSRRGHHRSCRSTRAPRTTPNGRDLGEPN